MEQQATFILDTKAVLKEDNGDELVIEGYASDFENDRQDEAFLPGAFDSAIKSFMENPALLYHHDYSKALGRVTELRKDEKGLFMRAVIDKPSAGSWAEDIFNKVRSGTIKGLSVGGRFFRKTTVGGEQRIHKADLMEISVTPMPVNPRTLFAVAGKAFDSQDDSPISDADIARLDAILDTVEASLDTVAARLSRQDVV